MRPGFTQYLKIIIIEDDPVTRKWLQEILDTSFSENFEVKPVGYLEDAFRLLEKRCFDVALLDLNLPDSMGLATLRELNQRYPYLAIVVTTGVYDERTGLEALTCGAQEYLVKGKYDEALLKKSIYYAVERKRMAMNLEEVNKCLLSFGANHDENINRIVESAGLVLGGKFVFYNKENGSDSYVAWQWNIDTGLKQKNSKVRPIRHGVAAEYNKGPFIIDDLNTTSYAKTNPDIKKYNLKTYIGCFIEIGGKVVGSLGIVYDKKRVFTSDEAKILSIFAKAIGIEEQRKEAKMKIVESEQKYRTLFENVNDAVFITDRKSNILLDVNKQAENLLGRSRKELIGMDKFQLYPPDKRDYYREQFTRQIQGLDVLDAELEVVKKDGSKACVFVNAETVAVSSPNIIQVILKDLSAVKRLEQEIIQANKMVTIGQLAAGVAHELNQPLTGVKGFAQTLLMDLDEQSPFREDLQKIIEQAERMNRIINGMRSFSRQSEFELQELDINKPIADSLLLVRQQLKVHNIKVETFLDKTLPKIEGDACQMQQVFLNLIINAKDAIDSLKSSKGGKLIIKTALSEDKKNIEITFQDTGCGISKETLEFVFKPYFSTKSPEESMGLGLSIVYRIIESHKGKIEVKSEANKGTSFKITLPILCRE